MYKYPIIEIKPRRFSVYGPFTVFKAKKDGSPYMVHEKTSWWDVNGFMIQTKKYKITVIFKRRTIGY